VVLRKDWVGSRADKENTLFRTARAALCHLRSSFARRRSGHVCTATRVSRHRKARIYPWQNEIVEVREELLVVVRSETMMLFVPWRTTKDTITQNVVEHVWQVEPRVDFGQHVRDDDVVTLRKRRLAQLAGKSVPLTRGGHHFFQCKLTMRVNGCNRRRLSVKMLTAT